LPRPPFVIRLQGLAKLTRRMFLISLYWFQTPLRFSEIRSWTFILRRFRFSSPFPHSQAGGGGGWLWGGGWFLGGGGFFFFFCLGFFVCWCVGGVVGEVGGGVWCGGVCFMALPTPVPYRIALPRVFFPPSSSELSFFLLPVFGSPV